jgi:hypothetical protein
MINKELAQKLEKQLRHGDKLKIAERTGFNKVTVWKFFAGRAEEMGQGDDIQEAIFQEAVTIIRNRQKRASSIQKIAEKL